MARALHELARTEGGVRGRFRFPPDLAVFDGHFPGNPLVPGVYLIEGARLLSEHFVGAALEIRSVETARFTCEVRPGDVVEAAATLSAQDERISCDVSFDNGGSAAARVKLRLARVPACSVS